MHVTHPQSMTQLDNLSVVSWHELEFLHSLLML